MFYKQCVSKLYTHLLPHLQFYISPSRTVGRWHCFAWSFFHQTCWAFSDDSHQCWLTIDSKFPLTGNSDLPWTSDEWVIFVLFGHPAQGRVELISRDGDRNDTVHSVPLTRSL